MTTDLTKLSDQDLQRMASELDDMIRAAQSSDDPDAAAHFAALSRDGLAALARVEAEQARRTSHAQGLTLLDKSRAAARAEREAADALIAAVIKAVDECPSGAADVFLRGSFALRALDNDLWPAVLALRDARKLAKAARDAVYQV